jgi:hypothetical protein
VAIRVSDVAGVAIEVDGWAWRWDAERLGGDRRRHDAVALAGWTMPRFTWHDLIQRPARVVAEIRAALAARTPAWVISDRRPSTAEQHQVHILRSPVTLGDSR